MSAPGTERRSPLDASHHRLGAKMVPFGGWLMPIAYPDGTIAEHLACRADAVAFDVSHLGTVRVEGAGAFDRLQATLTNDLTKIGPGRAQYTHLLDPDDASVVDDIIVWWLDQECFDVMPNASNTSGVIAALTDSPASADGDASAGLEGAGEAAGDGATPAVEVVDSTAERAIIAVQGPRARARLESLVPDAAAVPRFGVRSFEWRGTSCRAAGTGYTGEDGVELAVPVEAAEELWQAVLELGIAPAGLGARDTLRLEAALPLHGHELGPGITPLQAGLGWVVAWEKPGGFRGKAPLMAERERGVARKLAGLASHGRQPPRPDCPVLVGGQAAGTVTSGNFSPTLGHGIALALLTPDIASGAAVDIEVRGRPLPATVTPLPFVARGHKAS